MPLSLPKLEFVCRYETPAKCCKYLVEDAEHDGIFHCLKLSNFRDEIDGQNKPEWMKIFDEVNENDNCQGYPIMKYLRVGYDCP